MKTPWSSDVQFRRYVLFKSVTWPAAHTQLYPLYKKELRSALRAPLLIIFPNCPFVTLSWVTLGHFDSQAKNSRTYKNFNGMSICLHVIIEQRQKPSLSDVLVVSPFIFSLISSFSALFIRGLGFVAHQVCCGPRRCHIPGMSRTHTYTVCQVPPKSDTAFYVLIPADFHFLPRIAVEDRRNCGWFQDLSLSWSLPIRRVHEVLMSKVKLAHTAVVRVPIGVPPF